MKISLMVMLVFFLGSIFSDSYADEMMIRKKIKLNVTNLFMSGSFDELEKMAEKYRNPDERTTSGLWKLTIFYYGFRVFTNTSFKDEGHWKIIKDQVEKWIAQYPKSPTANIAKGIILKNYAWKIRGGGWASEVPDGAWGPFKDNLRIAKEHMLETKQIADRDPHWYDVISDIQNGLGEDKESYLKLISEGLDKYPYYYQLYFSVIEYLAPKWHGDKRQIEEFANQAVMRTKSREGMGMYARIYWFASQTQYDEKLFVDSNVIWRKMKQGINDVLEKYDDSWNIQNFAYFSCLAKDKEMTRKLMERIKDPIIMQAWKKQEYYNHCKKYAFSEIKS